jgi:hypothetical protein
VNPIQRCTVGSCGALLRRRPDVTSWHALLEDARAQYERSRQDGLSNDELVAS